MRSFLSYDPIVCLTLSRNIADEPPLFATAIYSVAVCLGLSRKSLKPPILKLHIQTPNSNPWNELSPLLSAAAGVFSNLWNKLCRRNRMPPSPVYYSPFGQCRKSLVPYKEKGRNSYAKYDIKNRLYLASIQWKERESNVWRKLIQRILPIL